MAGLHPVLEPSCRGFESGIGGSAFAVLREDGVVLAPLRRDSLRLTKTRGCLAEARRSRAKAGGEAGIRTLGTGFSPYNGLANRTGTSDPRDLRQKSRVSGRSRAYALGGVGLRWVAIGPRGHRHGHRPRGPWRQTGRTCASGCRRPLKDEFLRPQPELRRVHRPAILANGGDAEADKTQPRTRVGDLLSDGRQRLDGVAAEGAAQ